MGYIKQYREETMRIYEEGAVSAATDQNTKRAYIDAIKELLDSIYDEYSKDNHFKWWKVIMNAGIIIARIMSARELAKKI